MAADRRSSRLSTIRARTTAAAAVVVALTLLIGAVLLVVVMRRTLESHIDEAARRRAQDVAALVRQGALPPVLAHTTEEANIVQVVDARNRVVSSTANLAGQPPIVRLSPGTTGPGARTVTNLPVRDERDDRFRVVTLVVDQPSGPVTVHAAESLERVNESVAVVRSSLLFGLPMMLGLVGFISWSIVGRALRPVDAIRQEVADITARDLSRRVPQPDADDEIGRLAQTMNEMLERLEASAERQRRFVADASHELQSPLASSLADLEVASATPDAADWVEIAAGLRADNQRMTKLVRDLLFLAKEDDPSKLPPPRPLVDLDDIVRTEVSRFEARSTVALDVALEPAEGRGNPDQLGRVVSNLLENANRYARSRITVELVSRDGSAVLAVSDDGPGVPLEERDRVFERFTRLDDSRSRDTGGAGLGLAIAKEIVEHHGGSIAVADNGGGARFEVTLPLATA
jgi:signal transduction histidine kinase